MDTTVCCRHSAQQPELWASLEMNTLLDHRFQHWTLKFEITVFLFKFLILFFVSVLISLTEF